MEFSVVSSSPTKNGNFCNKIQNKSVIKVETEFGNVEQERQQTFYLFTKTQNEIGKKANLDISKFEVVSKDYNIEEGELAGETITLKYLYPKVG
jgi:hypothetical protein